MTNETTMTNDKNKASQARRPDGLATAEGALSALAHDRPEVGMTLAKSARALETVLEEIADPAEAREAFEAHLAADRRLDLLVAMGDLDAVAALLAAPADVFAAIIKDLLCAVPVKAMIADDPELRTEMRPMLDAAASEVRAEEASEDEASSPDASHDDDDDDGDVLEEPQEPADRVIDPVGLLPWVHKIRQRDDYPVLLDEMVCHRPFRDWVLLALYADADDGRQGIASAAFDEVGLEVRESRERLAELTSSGRDCCFNRFELEDEYERFRGNMRAPAKTAAEKQIAPLKDTIDL